MPRKEHFRYIIVFFKSLKIILKWIFSHGVDKTVISYKFDPEEFKKIALQGTIQINKLTSKLIYNLILGS